MRSPGCGCREAPTARCAGRRADAGRLAHAARGLDHLPHRHPDRPPQLQWTGRKCTEKGWGQYLDVFKSKRFPGRTHGARSVGRDDGADQAPRRHRSAVLADKHLRGIGFFRTVFIAGHGHQRGGGQPGLVRVAAARDRRAVRSDFSDWIPTAEDPDCCAAGYRCRRWRSAASGRASGSRSSSSPPACRACRSCTSAYVDGAAAPSRFTSVTLPMLSPSILFIGVVLTTRALQTYGEVALLTGGGPEPESPPPHPVLDLRPELDHR